MDEEPQKKKTNIILLISFVIIIAFIILGSALIGTSNSTTVCSEQVIDYTNCVKLLETDLTCAEYTKTHYELCVCSDRLNVTVDLGAGEVILYYILDEYDHKKYAESRDDVQLSGHLSTNVSAACDPYNYTSDGNPIAPCGALADSMFNDTFEILAMDNLKKKINLTMLEYGMLSNKGNYHNPPGNESLEVLFQNYSKPINWDKNVWELSSNRSCNGFENERFIGWMDTNLKRKPAFRLDPTNDYNSLKDKDVEFGFRVFYNYPSRLYSGPRKTIITVTQVIEGSTAKYVIGIVILVIALLAFVVAVLKLVRLIQENKEPFNFSINISAFKK